MLYSSLYDLLSDKFATSRSSGARAIYTDFVELGKDVGDISTQLSCEMIPGRCPCCNVLVQND